MCKQPYLNLHPRLYLYLLPIYSYPLQRSALTGTLRLSSPARAFNEPFRRSRPGMPLLQQSCDRAPFKGALKRLLYRGLSLKGSFKRDVDMGIAIDIDVYVDSDMAVSTLNSGSFKRGLGSRCKAGVGLTWSF